MALLSKARSHGVKDLSRYRGGYLGEAGTARYFIASKEKVPDYTRLYWVMVGVLSDKYGCFMVSRAKRGDVVTIKCRDQRRMVFWRKNGLRWVSFRVRQFDREGFEIAVRNRRIVRISEEVKVRFR